MAKTNTKTKTKTASRARKAPPAVLPWPGPTRLYDPDVDCGAVLLTGEQARALVAAVALVFESRGAPPESVGRHLFPAIEAINVTFGLGIGD